MLDHILLLLFSLMHYSHRLWSVAIGGHLVILCSAFQIMGIQVRPSDSNIWRFYRLLFGHAGENFWFSC